MQGYARAHTRRISPFVRIVKMFTMEEALDKMRHLIRFAGEWTDLASYIPKEWRFDPVRRRAATAAHFAASLELQNPVMLNYDSLTPLGVLNWQRKTPG